MKILEPNQTSDRMAVIVVDDKMKLLDTTDATEEEAEKFVEDNIRRYVPCTILGFYERAQDSKPKKTKGTSKKSKTPEPEEDEDVIGDVDDAEDSTEGDAAETPAAPNKFPRPKPVAQPREYD